MRGLQVKARRWFSTHTAHVDWNGNFSCDGTFKYAARYVVHFQRYHFEVRDAWLNRANIRGPYFKSAWRLEIRPNTREHFEATIFRAAYHYYYEYIGGLTSPPQNAWYRTQLKLKAKYHTKKDRTSNFLGFRGFVGLGSAIKIYNGFYDSEIDTYSVTIHELAHAAHWGQHRYDLNYGDDFVTESWAMGVEHYLTNMRYKYRTSYGRRAYTGIVLDLIDGVGIRKVSSYYYHSLHKADGYTSLSRSYIDNVTGYTLRQIEDALDGARTAEQWKNNLKNKYDNKTEKHLDATFAFWISK